MSFHLLPNRRGAIGGNISRKKTFWLVFCSQTLKRREEWKIGDSTSSADSLGTKVQKIRYKEKDKTDKWRKRENSGAANEKRIELIYCDEIERKKGSINLRQRQLGLRGGAKVENLSHGPEVSGSIYNSTLRSLKCLSNQYYLGTEVR